MEITKYPDGSSYVTTYREKSESIFKINSYKDLWYLNQFVDSYNFNYRESPTIIIPNLIDSQADRRFAPDQSSGLKLVCNFLNDMEANFKIFHPHNPEVVEALIDNVEIIDNSNFIKEVIWKLNNDNNDSIAAINKQKGNLILMSSDAGGFKPLMKLCDKLKWEGETYSASKARDPKTGKLTQLIDREDFGGKDILIVDDICVYGGTFKGLATMLKERNCGKLYLAVSHMTIQNLGEDPVTNYFDKVFTTNSKFNSYNAGYSGNNMAPVQPKNLEIIKLF